MREEERLDAPPPGAYLMASRAQRHPAAPAIGVSSGYITARARL